MASPIPLIRLGAGAPLVRQLRLEGHDADALLRAAGLPTDVAAHACAAVSFHDMLALFRLAAVVAGADVGSRAGTIEGLSGMVSMSVPLQRGRDVRAALREAEKGFFRHASHEQLSVTVEGGEMVVRDRMFFRLSPIDSHLSQQYVAAFVVALVEQVAPDLRPRVRVVLPPHPTLGLAHLEARFGPGLTAGPARVMEVRAPAEVLDRPTPWADSAATDSPPDIDLSGLSHDTLSASLSLLLAGRLGQGETGIDRLARAAGRSRRTLQRQLTAEGTSLAELLDMLRRDEVLRRLKGTREPVASIAGTVGYRNASSLTRAVRRWTGESPRMVRMRGIA